MLSGCNNDEKLAKETYELLNEACEHTNMYVTDQFNLSCSIHDDLLISTDNLYANETEIAKAYVLFSEKYLDDIKVDDDFNLDEQYDLFINTINSVRKTNLDFAFLGGEQIIQIVYKENGSINTIKTNTNG